MIVDKNFSLNFRTFKGAKFLQFYRTLRQSFQMSPNRKFYSCSTKFCIQCPFWPDEKQIQYLFAYVRLSPLGTGPKYNNYLLLRRWLWTKPSWWSISHSLIYSCAIAKQPSYKQKLQQELLKYPGTLELRFGRRIKTRERSFVLLSFELFDENWGSQGNFKPWNTHE